MDEPYANPDGAIIELEVASADGGYEVLETTYSHPFWVVDQGWTQVIDLEVGDRLESPDGELVVVGLAWTGDVETVYNLGVEQTQSYFVGKFGAWVHNCFDWAHILRNHTPGGQTVRQGGANSSKTLFKGFSDDQVKKIVKDAWKSAKKDGKQQVHPGTGDVKTTLCGTERTP